jgi:hypothetical protein
MISSPKDVTENVSVIKTHMDSARKQNENIMILFCIKLGVDHLTMSSCMCHSPFGKYTNIFLSYKIWEAVFFQNSKMFSAADVQLYTLKLCFPSESNKVKFVSTIYILSL